MRLIFVPSIRADTVALWLFDEQAGVAPSSMLNDAGPGGYSLMLGRGAEIAPGKFGNALRPISPGPLPITYAGSTAGNGGIASGLRPPAARVGRTQPAPRWENAHFAALATSGAAHLRRAASAHATDSKLNLGTGDWTVECWLRLEAGAADEGVIFEIGSGPRGENELVTRFSVLPRENAFGLAGISAEQPPGTAKRIEYANPEGPPGGVAWLHATTLAASGAPLAREAWFHVALVHIAANGELRLFIDGRHRAVAAAKIAPLPHGDESCVSIGRDARGLRPVAGAIDELRVSDHAVYARDGAPPGSFSHTRRGARRPRKATTQEVMHRLVQRGDGFGPLAAPCALKRASATPSHE